MLRPVGNTPSSALREMEGRMSRTGESSIVSKCAKVMDIVSHASKPLAFSEIVTRTGFVKSSAHRILAVLQKEELIEYDVISRTYRAGPRLHDWARSVWRRIDLQRTASEAMSALSEQTGMNTALSVLDRDEVLYLRTVDVIQFRFASHAGDHAPLHSTAAGKVFLAYMSERRRKETLGKLKFEKFSDHTITDTLKLERELERTRREGFGRAMGEEVGQVTGIAAPIWDGEEKVTACLSLWSLLEHASRDEVLAKSKELVETTNEISRQLGWIG
jgi:DNA-binding IclR family transcriptional regulator